MKRINILIILLVMIAISGCNGKYCIKTNIEKYGVEGEICYDATASEIEGTVVFKDKDGNQVLGVSETNINTILELIKKGKDMWDKSKEFFGLEKKKKYKELQFYLEKYKKAKNLK